MTDTQIDGSALIGGVSRRLDKVFEAIDPSSGDVIGPGFSESGAEEVDEACRMAAEAFPVYRESLPDARAAFLDVIADEIDRVGNALIDRASLETGLPRARLEGERARTTKQLRLFADVVRRGDWIGATIDTAQPDRAPVPRAELRLRHVAIGPVAVFGASNFPLAFSTAGGDTASALAAGCPVVVKGHPAHPGTSELVARAVNRAVASAGLHPGVFSMLPGSSHKLGAALVGDRRIKAVGFTGSRSGGLALVKAAQSRPEPIPIFAEMSSVNPVILLPAALAARAGALGTAFVQSMTLGAGQFCTNPGLVLAVEGAGLDRFLDAAASALTVSVPIQMLTAEIHRHFEAGIEQLESHTAVRVIARGAVGEDLACARGAIFEVGAADFIADATLSREVFGAASIVVRCGDLEQLGSVVRSLEGQLTATCHFDALDHPAAAWLLPMLEDKAGRVLANDWPTGVEVVDAMVHGGPFPATSDVRTTSVGSLAISRFLRPIAYQNLPEELYPPALRADNPLQIGRRLDGVLVRPNV